MKTAATIAALCIALSLAAPLAAAHLAAGDDVSAQGYLIDFGYAPAVPQAGATADFAFNLINDTTKQIIAPRSVWVRITQGDNVTFAGTFYPAAEHAAFSLTLPSAGAYDILARFEGPNGTLVQKAFEVNATGTSDTPGLPDDALPALLGAAAGAACVVLIFAATAFTKRRRKR